MKQSANSVGLFAAKTHLSELVERVSRGESISITKHGKTMAVMTPPARPRKRSARQLMELFLEKTKHTRLGKGETIKDLINEGRQR